MLSPLPLRLTSSVLLVTFCNLLCPVATLWAEVQSPPAAPAGTSDLRSLDRPPGAVKANRTLPAGIVTGGARARHFSSAPTDEEILRTGILPDPLVPVGKATTPAENAALAQALLAYEQSGSNDDLQPFVAFLAQYPDSAWAPSVHLNMGLRYFATSWFSKALTEYAEAWALTKNAADPHGLTVGDRSIGELLELNARLGRYDVLEKLFDEIKGRVFHGSAQELVTAAREGLWSMQHHPELSFRCGPGALRLILEQQPKPALFSVSEKIMNSRSSTKGTSLSQLWKLSQDVGLNYQMAQRLPGATLIVPAVVHWKIGHYAALLSLNHGIGQLQDPTFGKPYIASMAALDAETSGYFLVPPGPLPSGWRPVSEAEGDTVWGRGDAQELDDTCDRDYDECTDDDSNDGGCGMPVASATLMICSLKLADTPLFYTPPKGPAVNFSLTYNQREAGQPSTFVFGNVGVRWTYNWLSYVDETQAVAGVDAQGHPNNYTYTPTVHLMGGGSEPYSASGIGQPVLSSWDFGFQDDSRAHLVKTDINTYVQTHVDGSSYVFGFADGTRYFLTQIIDPVGNALTLHYDSQLRLVSVTDALGQVSLLSYTASDPLKLTKVTDPFGRSCQLDYNASGLLSQITDMLGLVSQFTYATDGSDFITSMTTPYGTSKFASDQGLTSGQRWLTMTDPLGNTERVEYHHAADLGDYPSVGPTPSGMTAYALYDQFRNTFYWDKRAYSQWPDVNAAHTYHWLHLKSNGNICSGVLENEKYAAEATRIWYSYPGQTWPLDSGTSNSPIKIGRVLDNGATQLTQYTYNPLGKVLSATDPLGRVTTYTYAANDFDLLEVDQMTHTGHDVLSRFTYNSQHEPLKVNDASGQTTTYTYNSAGQPRTVTNAKNETTTFWYTPDGSPLGASPNPNATGYLVETDGPVLGAKTLFTYDGYGRVRTVTDSEGYAVTVDFDIFNRPLTLTYPDGTTVRNFYDRLDLSLQIDRLGRATRYTHNALRQLSMVTDAQDRRTLYDLCGCGALQAITDPDGHTTHFGYDIQGRLTSKLYPDGTGLTYTYENNTSRRQSLKDALGQVTHYGYNLDDTLQQVIYTDVSGNPLVPATPSVSFTYDTYYSRPQTMTDSTGTTTWTYNPVPVTPTLGAGRLASVAGPLANSTIAYTYDPLGRQLTRSINGSANTTTAHYDSLGRVDTTTTPLGTFTLAYVGVTGRLDHLLYPNGQRTNYGYYPISTATPGNDDRRLQQIVNLTPGAANLTTFAYTYNAMGTIQSWSRKYDAAAALTSAFTYDAADQLLTASVPSSASVMKNYRYLYDSAGNRTSEQIDNGVAAATVNTLNQVTALSSAGPIHFAGALNVPSAVTVNGVAATVDAANHFSTDVPLDPGANVVAVSATNGNGVNTTKHYQYTVANGVARTLTYDLDGGMLNDGAGKTYTYDAANRLSTITRGGNVTTFVYNGSGQRVQEKLNGTLIKQWVWCPGDAQPAEERDASNNVTKRFFGLGQINGSTKLFYTKDHLGSVREMTDSTGAVRARYEYDPYGRLTKVSGDLEADFGFTGFYRHQTSGLNLTITRAYDADLSRWLSRDTLQDAEMLQGPNLYRYVANNPINAIDPLGLRADWGQAAKGLASIGLGVLGTIALIAAEGGSGGLATAGVAVGATFVAGAYSYGIGNIVGAFSNDEKSAALMEGSPTDPAQLVARGVGGETAQDAVGVAEALIELNAAKGGLEMTKAIVTLSDAEKGLLDSKDKLDKGKKTPCK